VSFVEDEPLVFASGSRYAYSNTDNLIVAFVVEAATGLRAASRAEGGRNRVYGPR
jgi:D-alanyl-D-alanine carboxypeptidase